RAHRRDAAHLRGARPAGAVAEGGEVGVALDIVAPGEGNAEPLRQDLGESRFGALAGAGGADDPVPAPLRRQPPGRPSAPPAGGLFAGLAAGRFDIIAEPDAAAPAARLRLLPARLEARPVGAFEGHVHSVLDLAGMNDHAHLVLPGELVGPDEVAAPDLGAV